MTTREEAVLELQRRGALTSEQEAAVAEMQRRGLLRSYKEQEKENVRREMQMTDEEWQDYRRERMRKGLVNRDKPSDFGLMTDAAADQLLLQDEMVGAGEFVRQLATGDKSIIDRKAWDEAAQAYSRGADRVRAEREVFGERYGNFALIPQIIGGIGSVAAKPLSLAAQAVAKAAPQTGNALLRWLAGAGQVAKTGAAYGGVTGYTGSEGGIMPRLFGGAAGAGTGAVVAPTLTHVVSPAVMAAATKAAQVADPARRAIASRFSSDPYAVMHRALRRQGQTPADAQAYLDEGQALARYGSTQTDLPEMIVDTGPATRRLSRAVEASPGEGASMAEEALNLRQRGSAPAVKDTDADYTPGQHARIVEHLQRGLKVTKDDFHKTKGRLIQEQKEAAAPLYQQFRDLKDGAGEPLKIDVGDILAASEADDALLAPEHKKIMQRARAQFMDEDIVRAVGRDENNQAILGRDAIVAKTPNYKLSPARFDSAKQVLDDMIDDAVKFGRNGEARILTELKNNLLERADSVTTIPLRGKDGKPILDKDGKPQWTSVYAQARDAFERPAKLIDALARGRTFMKGDSEVTAADYKAMSTGEKRMFRVGMAYQARKDLGQKVKGADRTAYFDRPNVQELLGEIMSRKEFERFAGLQQREGKMVSSLRSIQGSRTTPTREDIDDLNFMGKQANEAQQAGSLFGYAMMQASKVVQRLTRMREEDATKLARMLYERDPKRQRVILQEIERKYGRPRAQRGLAAAIREIQRAERARARTQHARNVLPYLGGTTAGGAAALHPDANSRR